MTQMKNSIKKPCDECPFRTKSLPGWLGGETPEDTFNHIVTEGDFSCHKQRHKAQENQSRCRGSILFLRKMGKLPRYNSDLAKAVMEVPFKEAFYDKNILSRNDFIKHHTQ